MNSRIKWALTALAFGTAIITGAGVCYEQFSRSAARVEFKPAGRLIDVGGYKLHLDCRGKGGPTIVLEAGLDRNGSLAWSSVHDRLALISRTCAYDRAGIMWSDPKPGIQDGEAVANDLHRLLRNAGENAPFVMVGHSLGGQYVLTFTRLYGADVAGLVLVDSSHPDQDAHFRAAGLPIPPSHGRWDTLLAETAWTGLVRLLTPKTIRNGFPNSAAVASDAYVGTSFPALMVETNNLARTEHQTRKLRTLDSRPLVVLTAAKPLSEALRLQFGFTKQQSGKFTSIWVDLHRTQTSLSKRGKLVLLPNATHYVQFDDPDTVVAAVREVASKGRQ